jgi:flagellar protein FliO/FliZ
MASTCGKIVLWMGWWAFPVMTFAADIPANNHHLVSGDSSISFSYIIQILISFAAVIFFILFLGWLMRKSGRFGVSGNKTIKIISSLSLGMREKIVVVNVEGINIVVGMAPGQIRTLHVLGDGPAGKEADADTESRGFGPILGKFLK